MEEDDEIIGTVIQMSSYTWEWVDISGVPIQVRMELTDTPTTFRFRPKPGYAAYWLEFISTKELEDQ